MVVFMKKLRRVVIYILNFNNEFRRRFQRSVSVSVYRLCRESVLSSFLPVQCLCCMDVPWFVINNKNDSCSFTWENVFNVSISRINIWMKLQNQKQTYLNKMVYISSTCLWNLKVHKISIISVILSYIRPQSALGHMLWTQLPCILGSCLHRPACQYSQGATETQALRFKEENMWEDIYNRFFVQINRKSHFCKDCVYFIGIIFY